MKRLYLMRHGHAPPAAVSGARGDAARPLSDQGCRDVEKVAGELFRRGSRPTLVLHSPLVRATQTGSIAAKVLGVPTSMCAALDNTLSAADAMPLLREAAGDAEEILAVGHVPQIAEFVGLFFNGVFEFRPAGLVALELEPAVRLLWSLNADQI